MDYKHVAMSKEAATEIVDKAIRKAIANGWERGKQLIENGWEYNDRLAMPEDMDDLALPSPFIILEGYSDDYVSIRDIFFDHDFARYLWGEEEREPELMLVTKQGWKGYLQGMVIADDIVQYMGENI